MIEAAAASSTHPARKDMTTPDTLKPGWKTWRFDQMAVNVNDRIENPSDANVEHYVGLEHLDPESLKIRRWGSPSDVEATKLLFRKGDIIFGRRRAYQRKLAVADFDGICSAHAMVLRAKPEVVLPEFLPFFMHSDLFMNRAMEISVGSLSPTINWKTLAAQKFALPPLDEQRQILKLLWAADTAYISYQDALNSAYLLRSAIRAEEFSPHNHMPKLLSELCDKGGIQIGPFGAQLHQSDYVEQGVPVVMPADMIDEQIRLEQISRIEEQKAQELRTHRVQRGDILLPRRGELDRRAYIDEDAIGWLCGTGSIRVRIKEGVSSRAVFHSIASVHTVRWLNGNAVGTTMLNLNSSIVGRIPVALPPEPRQMMVVECLEELQQGIQELKERLAQARQIRAKLLNQVGSVANAVQ